MDKEAKEVERKRQQAKRQGQRQELKQEKQREEVSQERQEVQAEQAQQYDSFLYKFQQQIIDAWKPVPHTSNNVILYFVLSVVCIGLGLGLILSAPSSQEVYLQYDNVSGCSITASTTIPTTSTHPCHVTFTLTDTLAAPVYLYYGLKGFYSNHRRYAREFDATQLTDGTRDTSSISSSCVNYVTNAQVYPSAVSTQGSTPLTTTDNAFPCGPIAKSYQEFKNQIKSFRLWASNGTGINIQRSGIAWPSDLNRHTNFDLTKQAFDVNEEEWLVWFRPAARSDFYKFNGIVQEDLPAGTYTITFLNNVNPTFGSKWVGLSKSNFVGNRDLFLGIAFLSLGGGCFILLVVFISKWIAEKRDKEKIN